MSPQLNLGSAEKLIKFINIINKYIVFLKTVLKKDEFLLIEDFLKNSKNCVK